MVMDDGTMRRKWFGKKKVSLSGGEMRTRGQELVSEGD